VDRQKGEAGVSGGGCAQMSKAVAKSLNERLFEPFTVGSTSKNWRTVGRDDLQCHREFIKTHYIHPAQYWETAGGKQDLNGLTFDRLQSDRKTYIPWINSFLPLRGARILEIGAGTGSSTVALAEQGAQVTGIDILEEGIAVAKDKCRLFGVDADLIVGNFLEYTPEFDFDAIMFFASLEHMLPEERLRALPRAWEMIRPGGYLVIVEAPNRLWYDDWHTSLLPFFNWLPQELALEYIQFSPRTELVNLLTPSSEDTLVELQRWGLGVSFHEFDVALGKHIRNSVGLSLQPFLRRRSPFRYIQWHITGHAKFARFLKRSAPDVPDAWFEAALDLAIQRP
jgi:2-polyprenyl-3-methyl-5-hydroxy-6-metoxy-1,4-benzoquinol methylase